MSLVGKGAHAPRPARVTASSKCSGSDSLASSIKGGTGTCAIFDGKGANPGPELQEARVENWPAVGGHPLFTVTCWNICVSAVASAAIPGSTTEGKDDVEERAESRWTSACVVACVFLGEG